MSEIYINAYGAVCNLGNSISEIFTNALDINANFLTNDDNIVKGKTFPLGKIKTELPQIKNIENLEKYNLRCNRILLHCLNQIESDVQNAIKKYGKNRIGIVIGTTNSGIDEYEISKDIDHSQIGNPAGFLQKYLKLDGYYSGVSTACTSGIKAFSTAQKLLQNDICDAVIAGSVDALSKMPVFGFHSLEVLSGRPSLPFSKNRNGINIGEGGGLFLLEKEANQNSIRIKGIGETSDAYHCATPDPKGIQASTAIKKALEQANLKPLDIDYINLHGTGTISNDLMEANAVYNVFQSNVPVSSTKSMTGHCLGASAGVETALCCALLDKKINPKNYILPHKYDGEYDTNLPQLKMTEYNETKHRLENVMCNAFGFGGSNAVIILGKKGG